MKPIRILLADDHTLVRAGIRSLLQSISGVEVVAEADDGREALRLIKIHQPDVILMDISMKRLNGLEAVARISREFPCVRVIILSMHTNEEYVLQALQAGAVGYMVKDAAITELELAVKAAARGEMYLSPGISKLVVEEYRRCAQSQVPDIRAQTSPYQQLTPRQREILQLIAEGHSTKEIAYLLNLSIKTVESHRSQLMKRLNVHDITGLVRYAIRMGLISPEK